MLLVISGSGKNSILRCKAGLTEPVSEYVSSDEQILFDSNEKRSLTSRERSIGFVFQDFTFFPTMTFRENIVYACGDIKRSNEFVKMEDQESVSSLNPDKLSSGQKQRCVLLPAVFCGTEILLLDEPFSSLDRDKKYFHIELQQGECHERKSHE